MSKILNNDVFQIIITKEGNKITADIKDDYTKTMTSIEKEAFIDPKQYTFPWMVINMLNDFIPKFREIVIRDDQSNKIIKPDFTK